MSMFYRDVLYVLTTTDGEKFLGHTAAIVNPCGDIAEPDSYKAGYVREGYSELIPANKILSAEKVEPFDCYYWDEETNDYVLFKIKYQEPESMDPESSKKRKLDLFSLAMDFDKMDKLIDDHVKLKKISAIRSWLLINAMCNGPVYIDSDYGISCKGEIIVLSKDAMPDYIIDGLKRGMK